MTVAGNSVSSDGGGIANSGTMTLADSTIADNSTYSLFGGGIYNSGTLTVTNSTIANNYAYGGGGGIYSNGTLTAVNTTIAYNSSNINILGEKLGGGLNVGGGTATLDNTIVALNGTPGFSLGPNDIAGTVSSSSAYNLIGTGGSGGLIDGNNGNQVGIANPGLGRLGDNGGPTPTIALPPAAPPSTRGAMPWPSIPPPDRPWPPISAAPASRGSWAGPWTSGPSSGPS